LKTKLVPRETKKKWNGMDTAQSIIWPGKTAGKLRKRVFFKRKNAELISKTHKKLKIQTFNPVITFYAPLKWAFGYALFPTLKHIEISSSFLLSRLSSPLLLKLRCLKSLKIVRKKCVFLCCCTLKTNFGWIRNF